MIIPEEDIKRVTDFQFTLLQKGSRVSSTNTKPNMLNSEGDLQHTILVLVCISNSNTAIGKAHKA